MDKAERGTAPERGHYDFPVLGGVAFALAASGHLIRRRLRRDPRPGGIEADHVIRLMALARRLDYNRAFPSLSWHTLADELTSEQTALLEACSQEFSPRGSAEVIADFHACVRSISRADTT